MYRNLSLHAYALAFAFAVALSCIPAAAQAYLGLYNSPKGFGLHADLNSRDRSTVNSITVYADIYGMSTARTREAGIVASYIQNYIFSTVDAEYAVFDFFAGAGVTAGYAHDNEKGFFTLSNQALTRERSAITALSGDIGVHADFGRRLSLELSFRTDLGIAMRRNRSNGALLFSMYKNGVFQALYPQISLMFAL